jgi:uncharacterized repeat protein (TIGR01451 family)
MFEIYRNRIKISIIIVLTVSALSLTLVLIEAYLWPFTARAQEPAKEKNPLLEGFSAETLAAFGLPSEIGPAAEVSFDLSVVKTSNKSTVNSGEAVTFDITITNTGPDTALGTLFQDKVPPEMESVNFNFDTDAVSNGAADPADKVWLLAPIPNGDSVNVSVTGILTSAPNVTVTNEAIVSAYNPDTENNDANNNSTVQVGILGYDPDAPVAGPIYLPLVFKAPPIVTVYYDDFSDNDSGWVKNFDVGDCEGGYTGGKYRIEADDEDCWVFAPGAAERRTGSFEVKAKRADGDDDKFAYGLYINGTGGDDYYLFRVWPKDDCGWEFTKREDDDTEYEKSGGCSSAIKRDSEENKLKMNHAGDGTINVYVNNTLLHSYKDSSPLSGKGTGLYVRGDTDDIDIRFDDFTVYNQ